MLKSKNHLPHAVSFRDVTINNGFWQNRQELIKDVTLGAVYDRFQETGRFASIKHEWQPGDHQEPHIFWDSDVTKWMEGAAYLLQHHDLPEWEMKLDELILTMDEVQEEDGYLNSYFSVLEPKARFTRRTDHELYCAGHLLEAALAYADATGKEKLLHIATRYIDLIDRVFREEQSAAFDTPGHQEIELALMKLYYRTGEKQYLTLAQYFIDKRGTSERDGTYDFADLTHLQSHAPVREQTTAEGHAVRALYQFAAVADLALATGDQTLYELAETFYENVTTKRMQITGGVGSTHRGESFTYDYDLPEYTSYNETCASIALMMFCRRMWLLEPESKYAQTAEWALYNTVLAGMSLTGDHFFYENPLAADPARHAFNASRPPSLQEHLPLIERVKVFDCSCCPPNLLRLIASIGDYMYSIQGTTIYTHLYMGGRAKLQVNGQALSLLQETDYPCDGRIRFTFEDDAQATLALRIPRWTPEWTLQVNGEALTPEYRSGYIKLDRRWQTGDLVELNLSMPLHSIESNPQVVFTAGRVAVMRGPLVYCAEGVDHPGVSVRDLRIRPGCHYEIDSAKTPQLAFPTLLLDGHVRPSSEALFQRANDNLLETKVKLIPYFAWANRGVSEMSVWLLRG